MRQEQTWCASKREGRPEDPGHGEQEEIEGQRGGQGPCLGIWNLF